MIVIAVHPWLVSLRDDILQAKRVGLWYPLSLPTEFMVKIRPGSLMIEDKKSWIQRMHSKPVPASLLKKLRGGGERIRGGYVGGGEVTVRGDYVDGGEVKLG